MRNWPIELAAVATPSAVLRLSGGVTRAITAIATPKVVPVRARPMKNPAPRYKVSGVFANAMTTRPST
jgi:hypothetical protein